MRKVAFKHFWSGFMRNPNRLEFWRRMFPNLRKFDLVDVTGNEAGADVVFFSHFFAHGAGGTRRGKARGIPLSEFAGRRVFWTGENEPTPDDGEWDTAMTHMIRDTVYYRDHHRRIPHWYPWLNLYHPKGVQALIREPGETIPTKDREVIFLCSHDTPERTAMIQALRDAGMTVDCYGRTKHNNTGGVPVPRGQHYELISRYRFALTFENEMAPGYCTEKVADAFASRTVPIYWGGVDACFNKDAFYDATPIKTSRSVDMRVIRTIEGYLPKLLASLPIGWASIDAAKPTLYNNELPDWATPESMTAWWSRVLGEGPNA